MAVAVVITKLCKNGIRYYSGCIHVNEVYILGGARTPIGAFQGKLSSLTGVDLASKALIAAIDKSHISKDDIEELVLGCTMAAGTGQGAAYQVARYAALKHSTVPWMVNKLCASGMKAVMLGCQLLYSHAQEVVAAGGFESLTNVPYILRRKPMRLGNICMADLIFHDGLIDMINQIEVSHYAEETARELNFTREEQDEYTIGSYAKATQATIDGLFQAEIVPVIVKNKDGDEETVCEDEQYKLFDEEHIKKCHPIVGKEGTVTMSNSSPLSDGASFMILASGNYILKKDLNPIARIVSFADASVPANKFCLSPSVVIPMALVRANLTSENICKWEISETFALTAMANTKLLKLNPDNVNVHGGAISQGHPFGMTGCRIILHLIHCLNQGEMGCAAISHATGGGSAIIIEKL